MNTISCPGCHALVPDLDGPTHAYLGAAPGCWAVFGEVLAREYGEWAYPAIHRLTVDAYAAQHPGAPSRQTIQSVAVHLIGLHLHLERGLGNAAIARAMSNATRRHDLVWLDPPPAWQTLTILDVQQAGDLAEHERRVRQWAEGVWLAWAAHHETIRRWAR